MSVANRIGLDIGTLPDAEVRIHAAADAGARVIRLRFPLGDHAYASTTFLDEAKRAVDAARSSRLRVLGVLDGGLTVAPSGAGTWSHDAPQALASAWTSEMAGNAGRLVTALAGRVVAWEVMPAPNLLKRGARRIDPSRWAAILAEVGPAARAADPEAVIIAGGLVSDELIDGVTYLREAAEAGNWSATNIPFGALGLVLRVAPDGGDSESIVTTLVSERAQRLWRAAAALIGVADLDGLWVTSVAWDAVKAGESAQARNLWTACDTLTANEQVRSVIWSGLVDAEGASGLFAATDLSPDSRRPAWRAFNDFAVYAAQIGVGPEMSLDEVEASSDDDSPDETLESESPQVADPWGIRMQTKEPSDAGQAAQAATEAGAVDSAEPTDTAEAADVLDADESVDDVELDGGDSDGLTDSTDSERGSSDDESGAESDTEADAEPDTGSKAAIGDTVEDAPIDHDEQPTSHTTSIAEPEPSIGADEPEPSIGADEPEPSIGADEPEPSIVAPEPTAPAPAPEQMPALRRIAFSVPRVVDLLRQEGLEGGDLEVALDAVTARYGSREWLPAGDYEVELPETRDDVAAGDPEARSDHPTNQRVLSAFYRAGGGTWTLLARAGLDLADLVTARGAEYDDPELESLEGLQDDEIAAIISELTSDR